MSTVASPSMADYTRSSWRRGLALYLEHPVIHAGRWFRFVSRKAWPGRLLHFTDGDGNRYISPKRNFTSLAVAVLGQRDPNVMRFLGRWLQPGDTVCDVGANVGTYTLPLARLVGPQGRIVAFEPNPTARACLRQNLRQNGIRHVHLSDAAAGPMAGTGSLVITPENHGEVHVAPSPQRPGRKVRVATIDGELSRLGCAQIAFLKLDVEGYELAALRGALATLTANPRLVVQTEIVPAHAARYGFTIVDLLSFFEAVGYRPHACDETGRMSLLSDRLASTEADWFWAKPDTLETGK